MIPGFLATLVKLNFSFKSSIFKNTKSLSSEFFKGRKTSEELTLRCAATINVF